MVYPKHQIWRDKLGIGAGWQDPVHYPGFPKEELTKLNRSHPRIPYTLEIETNNYWGNYEREFIGYCFGILDDVQMDIDYSEEERAMFWEEVFGKEPPSFSEALDSYNLLRLFLFETFKDVDDWYQLTFYDFECHGKNILKIQLVQPLDEYWESIIIPRMYNFFEKRIYKWLPPDIKLLSIKLYNNKHELIKEY